MLLGGLKMVTEPAVDIAIQEIEFLRSALPNSYKNPRFFKRGGTRDCYISEWGPGNENRIIKVDRKPESPRAIRHVERGYNTSNDVRTLANIKEPERNHLSRLIDYYDADGVAISIEPYFESKSLEEVVQENPLSRGEFEAVFSQVVNGLKYFV